MLYVAVGVRLSDGKAGKPDILEKARIARKNCRRLDSDFVDIGESALESDQYQEVVAMTTLLEN